MNARTKVLDVATSFSIATPDDWMILDVGPSWRDSLRELIAARHDRYGELAGDGRELFEEAIRRSVERTVEAGAAFCACHARVVEARFLVMASASVFVTELEERWEHLEASVRAFHPGWHPRQAGVIELPAGTAVRFAGHQLPDGEHVRRESVIHQYFIPARSSSQVAILTFHTPTVAFAHELGELFDAMATTFEFRYSD